MYNPSYLIQSRHNIYYFRYPIPTNPQRKVSISLKTRCPREALRLAKILEYHSVRILETLDYHIMDYTEIKAILKDQFAKLLKVKKLTMNEFGPLSRDEVQKLEKSIKLIDTMIENDIDDFDTLNRSDTPEEEQDIHKAIINLSDQYELGLKLGSAEYNITRKQYKHALKGLFHDILSYHRQLSDYSSLEGEAHNIGTNHHKPTHKLQTVIDKYIAEIKGTIEDKSLDDLTSCLEYLVELFGENFSITRIDGDQARYVKDCLLKTPSRRKTMTKTKGLSLQEQIKITDMPCLAPRTINKYLDYFSGLFKWAVNNKYLKENPFEKMSVRDHKDGKRDNFSQEELTRIFAELDKGKNGLANNDFRYWSTLIFLYTGARRNEIASLTPNDVMYDQQNDIHYFRIKDEKKSKRKNKDVFRLVPVHSDLIKRDFLQYVEKVKAMKNKDIRLLYQLSEVEGHGWGKKLTYWFSKVLLPKLEIKRKETSLHSTRHTFITRIKESDIEYAIIDAIVGHEGRGIGESIYTERSERHLPVFKNAIEKLRY